MKRRPGGSSTLGIIDYLEPARLIERRRLLAWVFDRHRVTAQFHAYLKPVLPVRSFADRNQKLARLSAAGSVDAKHIPKVTVGPLIERPQDLDARQDSHDIA